MASSTWYRLDNVGKFYASQAGSSHQTVFRLAATMDNEVDPKALQSALDFTIARFPGFNVCLKNGLFWHYLEPAESAPKVEKETLPACYPLCTGAKSRLIRVSYYHCRINVEVAHIISDGRGSLEFLKTLLGAYEAQQSGRVIALADYPGTEAGKTEDSFSAHYERAAAGKNSQPKIYRISGWKSDIPTYLELHYPADAVHQRAKAAGVSVTSWLIAAVIAAIREDMPPAERNRSIHMDVPVDLRDLFGSTTLRNFFGLTYISYTPGKTDEALGDIATEVQRQLSSGTEPAAIKRRMMSMVKLEKNPLVRMAPLILKDAILNLASKKTAREVTCTVSSLGRVTLDDTLASHVQGISALTSPAGLNVILCTCGNDLCISISNRLVSQRFARHFVRLLAAEGIEGYLNLDKSPGEAEHAIHEATLENRLTAIGSKWQQQQKVTPKRT